MLRAKRAVAALVLALAFGAGTARAGMVLADANSFGCKDCNVILISLDTLRADVLGAYGSDLGLSPAIDRAAKRGIVFSNAYAAAPWTMPSHMSVFSSLYSQRHNIRNAWGPEKLDAADPTLAEILKKRGYKTAWAWIAPYPSTDSMMLCSHGGYGRGLDEYINEALIRDADSPTVFRWLEKNATNRFFLFLHNNHMHDPYAPRWETLKQFSGRLRRKNFLTHEEILERTEEDILNNPSLIFSSQTIALHPEVFGLKDMNGKQDGIRKLMTRLQHKSYWYNALLERMFWPQFDLSRPDDISDLRALYSMRLYELDRWFGALQRKLDDLGLRNKTLIVLMSDHGEELGDHGGLRHIQLHEEVLRIPLIFLLPSGNGKRVSGMASNVDIFPTVLAALGLEIPRSIQGISLKPLIEGRPYPDSRPVFSDFWDKSAYAVRDSSYAYIVDRSNGFEEKFYDRINDRGETLNLIGSGGAAPVDKYRRILSEYIGGRHQKP